MGRTQRRLRPTPSAHERITHSGCQPSKYDLLFLEFPTTTLKEKVSVRGMGPSFSQTLKRDEVKYSFCFMSRYHNFEIFDDILLIRN